MSSCTQNVGMVDVRVNGRLVRLVDTPGFDDTYLSDAEVLQRIVFELGMQQVRPSDIYPIPVWLTNAMV